MTYMTHMTKSAPIYNDIYTLRHINT